MGLDVCHRYRLHYKKLSFDESFVDTLQLSEENELVGIILGGLYVGAFVRSSAIRA